MKRDLKAAKSRMISGELTLVMAKDGRVIFESREHGIIGFMEAIDTLGSAVREAAVADKVVGKAIALLSVYAGVDALYAFILSHEAKKVLERNHIYFEWESLVENIRGADMRNLCPFEKATLEIDDSGEAYRKFKAMIKRLSER